MSRVIFGLLDESRLSKFFENKICVECKHMLHEYKTSKLTSDQGKQVLTLKCDIKLPCWADTDLKFNVVSEESEIKECAAFEKGKNKVTNLRYSNIYDQRWMNALLFFVNIKSKFDTGYYTMVYNDVYFSPANSRIEIDKEAGTVHFITEHEGSITKLLMYENNKNVDRGARSTIKRYKKDVMDKIQFFRRGT